MSEIVSEALIKPRFKVGDLVILNEVERPCGKMVCVVVFDHAPMGLNYGVVYLNADPDFDSFCKPSIRGSLNEATLVEDFGVELRISCPQSAGDRPEYWFEKTGKSKAKYKDGKPRGWQENGLYKCELRRSTLQYLKLEAVISPTRKEEIEMGQQPKKSAEELESELITIAERFRVEQLAERMLVAMMSNPGVDLGCYEEYAEVCFEAAKYFIYEAKRRASSPKGE